MPRAQAGSGGTAKQGYKTPRPEKPKKLKTDKQYVADSKRAKAIRATGAKRGK